MMRRIAAAAALACAAAVAAAQPVPAPVAQAPVASEDERVAAAERLIDLMWPTDALEALASGLIAEDARDDLGQDPAAKRRDPHHRERARLSQQAILEEVIRVGRDLGPHVRSLFAEAFARHLSAQEIEAASAFYSSPSGRRFATEALAIEADPVYGRAFDGLSPTFDEMIDSIERRFAAETAHLPPLGPSSRRSGNAEAPTLPAPPRAGPVSAVDLPGPPPELARLAAARRAVSTLWPAELWERRMNFEPVAEGLLALRIGELGIPLSAGAGISPEGTIGELLAGEDRHFRERIRIGLRIFSEELARMGAEVRPEAMRLLAEFYARRFTVAELDDIAGFYGSPAGRRFSTQSLAMIEDPALARGFVQLLPRVAMQIPAVIERVSAATAHLPPPPPRLEIPRPPSEGGKGQRPRSPTAVQPSLRRGN